MKPELIPTQAIYPRKGQTQVFAFECHCHREQLEIVIMSKQVMRHVDFSQLEGNQVVNTSEYIEERPYI